MIDLDQLRLARPLTHPLQRFELPILNRAFEELFRKHVTVYLMARGEWLIAKQVQNPPRLIINDQQIDVCTKGGSSQSFNQLYVGRSPHMIYLQAGQTADELGLLYHGVCYSPRRRRNT